MRALAAEIAATGDAVPAYVSSVTVKKRCHVDARFAAAVVRFLTRAGVLNTHPSLAAKRTRYRSDEPLDANALEAEAAIASGALLRPRVTAAEATPLGPGEFIIEGAGGGLYIATNETGFKGVTLSEGRFRAQLCFSGARKSLGTFATATEAAMEYDKGARA